MSKLLVIFVVVVVAIFAFASARTQPKGDDFRNWLRGHQASFDRTPRVNLSEVRCPQLNGDTVVVPRLTRVVCTIAASQSRAPSRKLTVTPATAGRFRVSFDPAAGETLMLRSPDHDCDQGNPRNLLIGEAGGTVTITPLEGAPIARIKLN